MGLFGKSKKNVEVIPLNEKGVEKYKVKRIHDNGDKKSKPISTEPQELTITEEGITFYDSNTCDLVDNYPWKDMKWFEVHPATKEWFIHLKDSEAKVVHISAKESLKIHTSAESFLKRFIRNCELSLYAPTKQRSNSLIGCADDAEEEHMVTKRARAMTGPVGGAAN
eukprot:TRINITY_DN5279_c0_g1_i1.p1 TRINITY_DN5279_c0_g1~~TRINITY_DN5279_c0_g1_i1.p1  ORF type:complete len:167 (-),score=36.04 TRINITY_DN5279_c0_g1_i1:96-596(-)